MAASLAFKKAFLRVHLVISSSNNTHFLCQGKIKFRMVDGINSNVIQCRNFSAKYVVWNCLAGSNCYTYVSPVVRAITVLKIEEIFQVISINVKR